MKEIKENGEKGEKEKKESDLLSLHFSIFFPLSPYMFFIISLHEQKQIKKYFKEISKTEGNGNWRYSG